MSYSKITVSTAMRRIKNEELVLPAIQRDFVWDPRRIYLFLDSLMRGYPIGTLLFWNTRQRVQYRVFDNEVIEDMRYTYRIKPEGRRGTMVLDGQQRLQSLYLALEGELNGKRLYFDVLSGLNHSDTSEPAYRFRFLEPKKASSENEQPATPRFWTPLGDIRRCKDIPWRHRLVEKCFRESGIERQSGPGNRMAQNIEIAYSKLKAEEILNHYTVDPDYGEESPPTPIHEILEIFVRVNSGGQVLAKSDLMFSLLQLQWEGAAESVEDLLDELNALGRFDFDKDFVLRCALVCCGCGARYDVDKLRDEATVAQIEASFPRIVRALQSSVAFLVNDARILDGRILGSYNSLIPFVYFLYHQDRQEPRDEATREHMKHALYLSLMTSVFARYASSRINGVIREALDPARSRSPESFPLEEVRAFTKRREGRGKIDNWLLQNNTLLLMNILERGAILPPGRRRHRPEVDHIFPASKLRAKGYESEQINDFANLRLVARRDNRWKSALDPKQYFEDQPEAAQRHMVPLDLLDYEQYDAFLVARRHKIWKRIQDFLGVADEDLPTDDRIAPGEEDNAIDRLEKQLRDLIHTRLHEGVGEQYWKKAIPSHVREGVKNRINDHISRHPNESWHDYASGRSRLDFCDVSDYETIILSKPNWDLFEPLFRRKGEFQRHMLAVRRFRNCVKHGRDIDRVERLNGEAGILWLRRSLDSVETSAEPAGSEGGDGPTPEDFMRLLTRIPVPRGQRQLYKALYDAGDEGRLQDELVDVMGRRDRHDLSGVMGALGRRINGTPGYGETHKPGTAMVFSFEKASDGQWRYRLLPEMRAALEDLGPPWLHKMTP